MSKSKSPDIVRSRRKTAKSPKLLDEIAFFQDHRDIASILDEHMDCFATYKDSIYAPYRTIRIKNATKFISNAPSLMRYINKCSRQIESDLCILFPRFKIKKKLLNPYYVEHNCELLVWIGKKEDGDDCILGMAQFCIQESYTNPSESVLYVVNLCALKQSESEKIARENRCRLGRTILEKLYQIGREKGCPRLELKSFDVNSTKFYIDLGYTPFVPKDIVDESDKYFYMDL